LWQLFDLDNSPVCRLRTRGGRDERKARIALACSCRAPKAPVELTSVVRVVMSAVNLMAMLVLKNL